MSDVNILKYINLDIEMYPMYTYLNVANAHMMKCNPNIFFAKINHNSTVFVIIFFIFKEININ